MLHAASYYGFKSISRAQFSWVEKNPLKPRNLSASKIKRYMVQSMYHDSVELHYSGSPHEVRLFMTSIALYFAGWEKTTVSCVYRVLCCHHTHNRHLGAAGSPELPGSIFSCWLIRPSCIWILCLLAVCEKTNKQNNNNNNQARCIANTDHDSY